MPVFKTCGCKTSWSETYGLEKIWVRNVLVRNVLVQNVQVQKVRVRNILVRNVRLGKVRLWKVPVLNVQVWNGPGPKRLDAKFPCPETSGSEKTGCETSWSETFRYRNSSPKSSGAKRAGVKVRNVRIRNVRVQNVRMRSVQVRIVRVQSLNNGSPLWRHSLGPIYNCATSWGLLMIVILSVPLYECDTSCAALWYYSTFRAFMIVTQFMIPVAPLWLWHSLRPLYYCGVPLLSIKFDWWFVTWFDRIGVTWYRWSNSLVWAGMIS